MGDGWPDLHYIEARLLDPDQRKRMLRMSRDGASFSAKGLYGTEGLAPREGLVTARLLLSLNADHGAQLSHMRWDGRIQKQSRYESKGDLSRLREFVESTHGGDAEVVGRYKRTGRWI